MTRDERRAVVRSARRRGGRRSPELLPALPGRPDIAPVPDFPGGATPDGRVARYLDDRFGGREVRVSPLSGDAQAACVTCATVKPSYPLAPTVWMVVAVTRTSSASSS